MKEFICMWASKERSLCKIDMPLTEVIQNLPVFNLDYPVLSRYERGETILRKEFEDLGHASKEILDELNSDNKIGDIYYLSNEETVLNAEIAIIRIS